MSDAQNPQGEATAGAPSATELARLLAHDLRTPLNAVRGYADLLLAGIAGPLAAGQLELVAEIARAGRRLELAVELARAVVEPSEGADEPQSHELRALLGEEGFAVDADGQVGPLTVVAAPWRRLIRACAGHLDGAPAPAGTRTARIVRGEGALLDLVMERTDMSECWQMSALRERQIRQLADGAAAALVSTAPHLPIVLRMFIG